MLKSISKHSDKVTNYLHFKFFGHEMSDKMRSFLKNLSWSFAGGILSSGIMFAVNILAGRKLGPYGFGQYNSLLSIATSLAIFILLGNDSSSVRYIADEEHEKRQKNIFSASFWLTIIQFIALILIVTVFRSFFESYFNAGWSLLVAGLLLSLTLAFKNLTDSYLRAFYLIKKQSIIRIFSSLATLIVFGLFFYLFKTQDYNKLVEAVVIGNLAFIIMGISLYYKNFAKFNLDDIKLLFNYNKYLMIGTIALSIISLEQFLIGHFVGTKELGIYSAYWYGSFLVVSHLTVYFVNIFWPATIRDKENLPGIIKKLRILIVKGFPFWLFADFGFLFLILALFGRHYPIRLEYLVLFPVAAFCSGLYLISMHLLYIDRIKLSSLVSLFTGVLLVSFLAIFKNLSLYLAFQIVLYGGLSFWIQEQVKKDSLKKVELQEN